MKKLLSLILVLALGVCLVACGASNNITEEKLKGTWSFDLGLATMMELSGDSLGAAMGMGDITPYLDAIPDDLALTVYMVFDGEGNLSAMLKKQEINDFYAGVINAILTEDTMYAIFEAQGMDKETVDATLSAQGITLSALISTTKLQLSGMDFTGAMTNVSSTIVKGDYLVMSEVDSYTIDGSKVITEDTVFEYDGTNLMINEINSDNENTAVFKQMLPLTVKKVNDKIDY